MSPYLFPVTVVKLTAQHHVVDGRTLCTLVGLSRPRDLDDDDLPGRP